MDEGDPHEQASEVLRELRELVGGPGYETLAKRHEALSKSNVGNLLKGTTTPRDTTVTAFIDACLDYGVRQLPPEQRDRRYWWQRYRQALRSTPEPTDTTVADYLDAVRVNFGKLQLDALIPLNDQDDHPPVHLREVFVGQDVRANPPRAELPRDVWLRLIDSGHLRPADLPAEFDRSLLTRLRESYQQRPRRSVLAVLAHPSATRTVLLGDPGSGKSTLARYLALVLADAMPPPPELQPIRGLVPLIVELRIYASDTWGGGDFLDLVDHLHADEGFGLPRATTEALLAAGRALVVFDGLDEVFDPNERTAISKRIAAFTGRYPRTKVVVTSREIGYQRAVLDTAGFVHHKLEDLTTEQVESFVRRWFDTALPEDPAQSVRLRSRLMAAVAESKAVSELAGNPLLLTILAIIGRRRELPRDRRAVHEHAVTVLVQHWDPNKYMLASRFSENLPTIVEDDKLELLRRVARRMQAAPTGLAGNHIPGVDLVEEFEQYLHDRLELPTHQARPGAEQMLEQFRHRNFILSRFGAGVYGFVHRAFLEYLAADDIVRRFSERKLDESDLLELFTTRWSDPAWHEVLRHVTGMLSEDFARMVVEHLLGLNPDWRRQKRTLPHHIVLALQCLSEVRRLGPLADTSRAVMRAVTEALVVASQRQRIYDSDLIQLLEGSIPQVLANFGPHWAGREAYRSWFTEHHRALSLQANQFSASVLVLATRVAALLSDDADLRGVLLEQARSGSTPAVRLAAISGLTCGQDEPPEVGALLRTLVTREHDSAVQSAALAGLKRWLTRDDAEWVRGLVSEGVEPGLASTAVAVVVEKWADDENTLSWLQGLLGRRVAVQPVADALASRWSPDSNVLVLLQRLAAEAPSVQAEAITAVGAGWAHVEGVREWLVDLAENGPSLARSAAVNAIGTAWRGDHDVIRWLHIRMTLETDESVRSDMVQALGETELAPSTEAEMRVWARCDVGGYVRQVAVQVLAKHVMSPELCVWLRETLASEQEGFVRATLVGLLSQADIPGDWARSIAVTDPDSSVRSEAVRAVMARAVEPDLLDWLMAVLQTEPEPYVRLEIVQMIVEGWQERQEILDWLRSEGTGVLDDSTALEGLAAGWLHEPWFVQRLQAAAAPGNAYERRRTAMDYLSVNWVEENEGLLHHAVTTDCDPFIRSMALSHLARRMGHTREELEWFRTRLVEDSAASVRISAFVQIIRRGRTSSVARAWAVDTIAAGAISEIHDQLAPYLHNEAHYQEQIHAALVNLAEHAPSERVRAATAPYATWNLDFIARAAWLRNRFERETSLLVRRTLLRKLGDLAYDAGLVEWLREVATSDQSELIRVEALACSANEPSELQTVFSTTVNIDAQHLLLNKIADRWRFDDGVEEWFIATAENDPLASKRGTALRVYARNWEMRPALLDWLWERFDDPSPLVRCAAVEQISRWSHLSGVTSRLLAHADPDLTVRLTLVDSHKFWRSSDAVMEWARSFAENDPEPTVRSAALEAVAEMRKGAPELVEWLMRRVAEDNDWEPRSKAIWHAALLGGHRQRILAWIRDLVTNEDDPMTRSAAVESWATVWSMNLKERTDMLRLGTDDPRPDVRAAVVRAVGDVRPGDPEISRWLRKQTMDPDAGVTQVATRELSSRVPVPPIPDDQRFSTHSR